MICIDVNLCIVKAPNLKVRGLLLPGAVCQQWKNMIVCKHGIVGQVIVLHVLTSSRFSGYTSN